MAMWRCINNETGYCKTQPEFTEATRKIGLTGGTDMYEVGGKCKNDWECCVNFRLLVEMVDLSKLPKPKDEKEAAEKANKKLVRNSKTTPKMKQASFIDDIPEIK